MKRSDRPNADPAFLARVQRIRDAERAAAAMALRGRGTRNEGNDGTEHYGAEPPPPRRPTGRPKDMQRRADYRAWHARGMTDAEIASAMGLSRSRAQSLRSELGLTPNTSRAA